MTPNHAAIREHVLEFVRNSDVDVRGELTAETSLVRSSLFDSAALFQLFLYVEEQIGAPLDPATFDLAEEWDTVNGIAAFIDARRG